MCVTLTIVMCLGSGACHCWVESPPLVLVLHAWKKPCESCLPAHVSVSLSFHLTSHPPLSPYFHTSLPSCNYIHENIVAAVLSPLLDLLNKCTGHL